MNRRLFRTARDAAVAIGSLGAAAYLVLNYFFLPPIGAFTIADP